MKVGVLTFHRAINYGAALQAYGLVRKMNELGFDAEIADYRNPHIENMYHKFSVNRVNSPKKAAIYFAGLAKSLKRKNAFKNFWKNIPTSRAVFESPAQLKKAGYDVFVTGSDQVWNPDCTKFDKTYFLDFAEHSQKASYAASFGVSSIDEKYREEAGKLIGDYKYISVREKQGAEIVKKLSDKESQVVLDPTFLLESNIWREVAKPSKYGREKYLLVYMLFNSSSLMDFAVKKANEQGFEVICIGSGRRKGITYAGDIGPAEFLDLIGRAELVVTNSFHGTAFSINLNKPFYVELHNLKNSRNSRMEDVLKLFDLEHRLIKNGDCTSEEINFDIVNKILDEERAKSVGFLKSVKKEGSV